jgi:biotin transporter BioY
MEIIVVGYIAGFVVTAAVYGWINKPSHEGLVAGTALSFFWPPIWLFAAVATVASVAREARDA